MSALSLPSHSFTAVSPLAATWLAVRRWAGLVLSSVADASRAEPRSVAEVRAWAQTLRAGQPGLAAELEAMANRCDATR